MQNVFSLMLYHVKEGSVGITMPHAECQMQSRETILAQCRARAHCQQRRSIVSPNQGFWRSLCALEEQLGITERQAQPGNPMHSLICLSIVMSVWMSTSDLRPILAGTISALYRAGLGPSQASAWHLRCKAQDCIRYYDIQLS